MADFFPHRDEDLATWSFNLITELPAVITALGLPATTDDAFIAARGAYATAFNNNLAGQADAAALKQAKDAARETMVEEMRQLVRQLRAHPLFTDQQAAQLGLPVYDSSPGTPTVPVPNEIPELLIDVSVAQKHRIKFSRGGGLGRGKPSWARACRIFYAVVPTGQGCPPIQQMLFLASQTRSPFTWVIDAAHVGKDVWYRGAWETPTGEIGDWSDPAKGTVTG